MTKARTAVRGWVARFAAVAALGLTLGGAPGVARAITLQIDSTASAVIYRQNFTICFPDDSGQIVCPDNTPQTLPLAGTLDLALSPYGAPEEGLQRLVITPLAVESPAIDLGFFAAPLVGLLKDGMFSALEDDVCSFPGSSVCVIQTGWPVTTFSGTWDGRSLAFAGSQSDVFSRFDFSIAAVAAAVPEPGTLLLSIPLLAFLRARRRAIAA